MKKNQLWYPLIHIEPKDDLGMQSLQELNLIVDKFAAALPFLGLDGDEQEEYSTMLLSASEPGRDRRAKRVDRERVP